MKLLYLSCHGVLEYDELQLFSELGVQVFSPGPFCTGGSDPLRPAVPGLVVDPEDVEAWSRVRAPAGHDQRDFLTREFVDRFDAVMVMHLPQWVLRNWSVMRHKPVVMRTIGQNISHNEQLLRPYRDDGLRVVRYSPKERTIPGYVGEDAVIRFYKNPEEFSGWTGHSEQVVTFCQAMPERGSHCGWDIWRQVTRDLPAKLYGPRNDAAGAANQGCVPYEDLKAAMREHRAYFYLGTHPASYTLNFMEAWLTGIPVVALGPRKGNASYLPGGEDLYEVHELIRHDESGLVSDDPVDLEGSIRMLLRDPEAAARIGDAGREAAARVFGKDVIKPLWADFFRSLT